MKPTLVIGASENPDRYSYKAIEMLRNHQHEVFAYGLKIGRVCDVEFMTDMDLRNYILSLKPQRVIFNPGTENPQWEAQLNDYGITTEEACTLVLLQTGQY
jgi:predicted CoA-binding protein